MATAARERRALVSAAKVDPVSAAALADHMEEGGESGPAVERRRLFSQWLPIIWAALNPTHRHGRLMSAAHPMAGATFAVRYCPKVHTATIAAFGRPYGFATNYQRSRCADPSYVARKVYETIDCVLAARP